MDWQTEIEYYKGRTLDSLSEPEQRALAALYLEQAGFDANFEALGTECQYHREGVDLSDTPPWASLWIEWALAINNKTSLADRLVDRISDDIVNYLRKTLDEALTGDSETDEHLVADSYERGRDVRATLRVIE